LVSSNLQDGRSLKLEGQRTAVHVDPGRPSASRDEPFYSEIKQWSKLGSSEMHQIVVTLGRRAIVVLPDRDVDLGQIADDEQILVGEIRSGSGRRFEALKVRADDPRIQGIKPGAVVSGRERLPSDSSGLFDLSGMSDDELEALLRLHQGGSR
jgi:hypothetical protein